MTLSGTPTRKLHGRRKLSLSEEERETSRKARQGGKSVEQAVREARETTRRRELESAGKRIQAVLSKGYGIKEVKVVYDAEGFLAKANASIDNGVLTFNGDKVDSAWAMYWTLGHELTHPAAATDSTLTPDILSTFRSLEQGGYFKDSHGGIDAHREALSELYRPVWEQQKTEQDFDAYVDEELAADLMRTAFQHQRTLDRLAGRTPTILEEAQAKVNRLPLRLPAGQGYPFPGTGQVRAGDPEWSPGEGAENGRAAAGEGRCYPVFRL